MPKPKGQPLTKLEQKKERLLLSVTNLTAKSLYRIFHLCLCLINQVFTLNLCPKV